jgi:hypothetical protein
MKNKESIPVTSPLKKWEASIQLFERKAENTIVALDKFEIIFNDIVEEETYQLFQQNPKMPLSKVIACVFEGINENTPPNLLVKVTKIIVNTWRKQQTATETIEEYELV